MIRLDHDLPHPQNREQCDIAYVKMETLQGLTTPEIEYLYNYIKQHTPAHGPERNQDVPLWDKMYQVTKHRRHMNELRVWIATQYSYADEHTSIWDKSFSSRFERWSRDNCYNQWYILYNQHDNRTVEILKPTRKYKRMKNKRYLKTEINKLTGEIASLQRRRRRLRHTINNITNKNVSRDDKTSVS